MIAWTDRELECFWDMLIKCLLFLSAWIILRWLHLYIYYKKLTASEASVAGNPEQFHRLAELEATLCSCRGWFYVIWVGPRRHDSSVHWIKTSSFIWMSNSLFCHNGAQTPTEASMVFGNLTWGVFVYDMKCFGTWRELFGYLTWGVMVYNMRCLAPGMSKSYLMGSGRTLQSMPFPVQKQNQL